MRLFAAALLLLAAGATLVAAHPHVNAPGEVEPSLVLVKSQLLRPRKMAPTFTATAVIDEKFEVLDLDSYRGKWVILFFYPFDFTYVCPTEILAFSNNVDAFKKLNTEVIGVSTDSHHTHLAWIRTPRTEGGLGSVNFPLVADISKKISAQYGVLVDDPSDDMYGAAIRGLFIVDPKGKIRHIQMNDDQVGRSVDEVTRLIQAFQYSDSHDGHVCPANWKPGAKTIVADQNEKLDFFRSVNQ